MSTENWFLLGWLAGFFFNPGIEWTFDKLRKRIHQRIADRLRNDDLYGPRGDDDTDVRS